MGANTNYPFDAFVTKLNREGTTLMASTFFGDTNGEAAEGVAVDASENIYITGATFSTGILNNNEAGFQWQNHGKGDAFVAKFDESLGRVSYFNCVGGTAPDYGRALHVSATGSVFIAGETSSESLPKSTNMFGKGGLDGFLAVFNATAPSAASVPAHRNGAEAPCE